MQPDSPAIEVFDQHIDAFISQPDAGHPLQQRLRLAGCENAGQPLGSRPACLGTQDGSAAGEDRSET